MSQAQRKSSFENPTHVPLEQVQFRLEQRANWEQRRKEMEERRAFANPKSPFNASKFGLGAWLKLAMKCVRFFGLERLMTKTVLKVQCRNIELTYRNLPAEFDGFTVLHITDPHFDGAEGLGEAICAALPKEEIDLCVLTGDYRFGTKGSFSQILPDVERLLNRLHCREGVWATLGNHDTYQMAESFEKMGVSCLLNESIKIIRGNSEIKVTGVDDVHRYYTEHAAAALDSESGFKIALVHSNELSKLASERGYDLYLCGHSHGGQVCLPFGIPLMVNSAEPRRYGKGLWKRGKMVGYTSPGAGSVGIPLRTFCPPEVTLFTLRRQS